MRIHRRTGGGKKLLMLAGGAAMVAVSMVPSSIPRPLGARAGRWAVAGIVGAPAAGRLPQRAGRAALSS